MLYHPIPTKIDAPFRAPTRRGVPQRRILTKNRAEIRAHASKDQQSRQKPAIDCQSISRSATRTRIKTPKSACTCADGTGRDRECALRARNGTLSRVREAFDQRHRTRLHHRTTRLMESGYMRSTGGSLGREKRNPSCGITHGDWYNVPSGVELAQKTHLACTENLDPCIRASGVGFSEIRANAAAPWVVLRLNITDGPWPVLPTGCQDLANLPPPKNACCHQMPMIRRDSTPATQVWIASQTNHAIRGINALPDAIFPQSGADVP